MKKLTISKLFLYKHRFGIGYAVLALAFLAIIIILPLVSPTGLSTAEMQSAVTSENLHFSNFTTGELADAPYHALQKISIDLFGLSAYAVKLPSIIIAALLGLLLVLLLNRWFKNNVAMLASIIAILSTPFLYLAGTGTPLIMLVFWPVLLLWLGSKIQGRNHPKPIYCFLFAFALLLALFTPYMIYLAIFIVLFAILNPHLRFTIKKLPKIPLIVTGVIILSGLAALGYGFFRHPDLVAQLFTATSFDGSQYLNNIKAGILPFFFGNNSDSVFLSPMFGLAALALALVGLISTAKGFFASRNAIASCFIVFAVILSGFNPEAAVLLVIPFAILTAHGLRYILEKWYGLFPENPYARVFAIFPISLFLGIIIVSDLSHYIFGYRYNPAVADQFNNDLVLIQENLLDQPTTLLIAANTTEYNFYQLLKDNNLTVASAIPNQPTGRLATLGKWPEKINGELNTIITSPKSHNSDRIYVYTVKTENKE